MSCVLLMSPIIYFPLLTGVTSWLFLVHLTFSVPQAKDQLLLQGAQIPLIGKQPQKWRCERSVCSLLLGGIPGSLGGPRWKIHVCVRNQHTHTCLTEFILPPLIVIKRCRVCSRKIKRRLLLGRKAVTNVNSVLKIRGIPLPTKLCIVKTMVFLVIMYGSEH